MGGGHGGTAGPGGVRPAGRGEEKVRRHFGHAGRPRRRRAGAGRPVQADGHADEMPENRHEHHAGQKGPAGGRALSDGERPGGLQAGHRHAAASEEGRQGVRKRPEG